MDWIRELDELKQKRDRLKYGTGSLEERESLLNTYAKGYGLGEVAYKIAVLAIEEKIKEEVESFHEEYERLNWRIQAQEKEIDRLKAHIDDRNKRINEIGLELDRYKQIQPWCMKDPYGNTYNTSTSRVLLFATKADADAVRLQTVSPDYWTPVLWDGKDKFLPPENERVVPGKAWCLKSVHSGKVHSPNSTPKLFATKSDAARYLDISDNLDPQNWSVEVWE